MRIAFSAANSSSVSEPWSCSADSLSSSATCSSSRRGRSAATGGVARLASSRVPLPRGASDVARLRFGELAGGLTAQPIDAEGEQDDEADYVGKLASGGGGTPEDHQQQRGVHRRVDSDGPFAQSRSQRAPQRRRWTGMSGKPRRDDDDQSVDDHRDRNVVEQSGGNRPHLVHGRLVVRVLHQRIDDVVSSEAPVQQREQSDAHKAPPGSAHGSAAATFGQPHTKGEQGEGEDGQDQREPLDPLGDVLHRPELLGSEDHEPAAGRRQVDAELRRRPPVPFLRWPSAWRWPPLPVAGPPARSRAD